MNIRTVIEALANQISTGPNMTGTAIAGRTYAFAPDAINPPCAIVLPAPDTPVQFDVTMDGQDTMSLQIKLIVGAQDERAGQKNLLDLLARSGTGSVYQAVAADPTLGGACSYAIVTHASSFGDIEWAGQIYFGAELAVDVQ